MQNKYLEKAASIASRAGNIIERGAQLLTGHRAKGLEKTINRRLDGHHVHSWEGTIGNATDLRKEISKVRVARGLAGGGAIGVGVAAKKYLDKRKSVEKQAGLADFIDDVVGSKVHKNKTMMDSLAEAEAAGKKFTDYAASHSTLRNASFKARLKVGGGAAGVASAGLYGLHRYKQNQRAKILKEYETLYKQAGVVSNVLQSAGRVAGKGFNRTIDTLNTANGGKVKTFAETMGLKGKAMDSFNAGSATQNARQLVRAARSHAASVGMGAEGRKVLVKKTMKNHRQLLKDKLDARMGLLGKGGALAGTYALGKHYGTKQAPTPTTDSQSYYY